MLDPIDRVIPHQSERIVGADLREYLRDVWDIQGVDRARIADAMRLAPTNDTFAGAIAIIAFEASAAQLDDPTSAANVRALMKSLPNINEAPVTKPFDGPPEAPNKPSGQGRNWTGYWNWRWPQ